MCLPCQTGESLRESRGRNAEVSLSQPWLNPERMYMGRDPSARLSQLYQRNSVPLYLTVPIAHTPTEEGDPGKEAGMRLEILCLEYGRILFCLLHQKKRKKKKVVFPEGRKVQVISINRSTSSPEPESRLLSRGWLLVPV